MMKINIAQLRQAIGASQSFSFHGTVEELTGEAGELWLRGRLEVTGEAVNTGRLLAISGEIKGESALNCDRCLTDFTREVAVTFSETFREEGSAATDPDALVYHGDEIDITEIVREALIVAEPLKALCDEECRGLCPVCGANRNENPCNCVTASIDPRLAALEKLLPKQ
ncbi:YceD family protein [Anaeroselena agilis]|uniref:DUF177 domain-containing protein n=1 Tax=Anaeroselena agilis TaxID=3063788 RepID=A0ABU3NWN6_9FIRM|nr:DUF177 domain-containing protein [Selenomonadales bacterium 4137-cl]